VPIFVNEAGLRMVGLDSLDEAKRHPVLDYFWPEDRDTIEKEAVPALQRDGRWRGETRFRHFKTGKPIHTIWNVTAIRDEKGRPLAWATVSPNLDSLKAAQRALEESQAQLVAEAAALRDSEERFHTLADNIAQFAWMADEKGRPFWYNERWFDYTGLTPEDMKDIARRRRVHHPEYVDGVLARLRRSFETGEPWEDTFPLRGKDGQYRWFLSRATPIRGADGRVERWFGTNTDVTELRQAEEALRQSDRRKDEFLATLAHELRNPLAPVRNALEIMKRAGGDLRLIEQARQTMDRQMLHLERLVDDLLDVSRITQDKLELRRQRVDLAALVQQVVETSRPLAEVAQQRIDVEIPAVPIQVDADPMRLGQVFSNLLSNASKYSDPGGEIRVVVRRSAQSASVSVQDRGIGIPPDMQSRIFEMFTQVPGSTQRAQGGLGIGLTLVRRLVEMHRGKVEVHSDGIGRGSEFVVELPLLHETGTAKPMETKVRPPATAARHRILVVDDNRDAAESLAMLLRFSGHETQLAHDGPEAVEVAQSFRPDVVLLDIGLPGMNGYDVAHRLRAQPGGVGLVLIALTGWGQEEDRRRSKAVGFDHHLVKPVHTDELAALLASLPKLGETERNHR